MGMGPGSSKRAWEFPQHQLLTHYLGANLSMKLLIAVLLVEETVDALPAPPVLHCSAS